VTALRRFQTATLHAVARRLNATSNRLRPLTFPGCGRPVEERNQTTMRLGLVAGRLADVMDEIDRRRDAEQQGFAHAIVTELVRRSEVRRQMREAQASA
jgi:hypothetical protein